MEADACRVGDEKVAGVGIPVEQPDHEDLVQVSIDEDLRQTRTVGSDGGIVDAPSATAHLDDDSLADELVDDAGNVNRWPVGKQEGEATYILCLAAEVALLSQVRPDLSTRRKG